MIDAGIVLLGGRCHVTINREQIIACDSIETLPDMARFSILASMANVFVYQGTRIVDGSVNLAAVSAVPVITAVELSDEVALAP